LSDAFKLGKYYFIMLAFEAEDGYYISPETELYINGEKADNDPVMSMVLKAMVHSFGELKEDVDPVEPTDPAEPSVPNPGTDDNSAVVLAVMVLLLGATLVVFRRKEER
jgi:LPXTG-motif cell wall-anchored protein